jgi:mannitol/fructose-specific phosphotransferase system IIA component (Ntr-type)
MPFQLLDIEGVADYLHLTTADVAERVKNREIPFECRGKRVVFRKREIEEWASRRILNMPGQRLSVYHDQSTRHTQEFLPGGAILQKMLRAGAVAPAMTSRTKASVLSDLVAVAEGTGRVCDAKALLEGLRAREELCSTGLEGGFALPHTRFNEWGLFETSFIVVGRTVQEIHFGAHDGEPTRLFFLVCCQDARLHLHALARLCLMAMKTEVMAQLLEAPDAQAMEEIVAAAEEAVVNRE